ncbi:hypothetical protein K458DRAFT_400268 [Lentithecium fluviatile CBS 122367]|uniref:Uncharacterized protein n=1 Tax=Lentithecium fluviatile CBS 122367 TaxID=1168545 RepID=A0A6G1JG52_9PLEO|nr:hypothetical protein K458DRAFT_400268 [Lentithecium fluviatile CBS 122367]
MCYLKELTFSCGHKGLSIRERCRATFSTNKETPFPPEYCRTGIRVTTTETSSAPCKKNCQRYHAVQTLSQRYEEAKKKIEKVSGRVLAVQKAAEKGLPVINFRNHGERGWDPRMLEKLYSQSLHDANSLLGEYSCVEKDLLEELEALYLAAKSDIKDYIVAYKGVSSELVSFDERQLEAFGNTAREQLRDLVCEIERRASEACLEKHGWALPDGDTEQCEVMLKRAAWKRGVLSGTRMDDGFVGKEQRETEYDIVPVQDTR